MSPDVAAHGCQCRGLLSESARQPLGTFSGWGQAQLGAGCQQDVTGQCHTAAGGAALALVPEQMTAAEVGLCPNTPHPSLGGSEPQGLARVPTPVPGKVTVPGVSSKPRELPRCAPATLTRTLPVQLPWLGSSHRAPGGTGQSCPCGCKPPQTSLNAFPHSRVLGCPPRAWNNPRGGLELRRGCQVLP